MNASCNGHYRSKYKCTIHTQKNNVRLLGANKCNVCENEMANYIFWWRDSCYEISQDPEQCSFQQNDLEHLSLKHIAMLEIVHLMVWSVRIAITVPWALYVHNLLRAKQPENICTIQQ